MSKRTGYDLNSLIMIGNITVCAISIYLYFKIGGNQYIDLFTLALLCLFGIENILMLLYEKKKRDPLVLLLLINALVFYMARVATLLYAPCSSALTIYSFTPVDINYSLVFIMFSNVSIFLGLSTAGAKIFYKEKDMTDRRPAKFRNVMMILLFATIISLWLPVAGDIIGRFAGYMSMLINLELILLFTIIYLMMNFNKLSIIKRMVLLSLVIIYVLRVTLCGSRGALLTVAYFFLVTILSIKGKVIFSKKVILVSAIIIPISMYFFIMATEIRRTYEDRLVIRSEHLNI